MRGSHLAWLSGAALLAGVTSCAVYGPDLLIEKQTSVGGQTSSGGSGSGGDGAGGVGTGGVGTGGIATGGTSFCLPRATYFGPPRSEDIVTPGGSREIVAAQWTIDLGDSPERGGTRFRTVGFDLDEKCTQAASVREPSFYSCRLPSYGVGMADGPGAIDNAMGSIIQGVRDLVADFSSENYTEQLQRGASNILFRVANYNGEPNDDQVRVEVFVAANYDVFTEGGLPDGGGGDVWPIASDSVQNDDRSRPRFFDDLAYVSNNKLVGSLARADLRIDVGLSSLQSQVKLKLELSGAFVQCDITPTTTGNWGFTLMNCILAGNWNADQLLGQLSQFPDPLDLQSAQPLCTNSGAYRAFKKTICEQVDAFDGVPGPSVLCNALSFGVEFDMVPALLGEVYPVNPPLPRCPPSFEPSNDTCTNLSAGGAGGAGTGGRGAGGAGGAGGAASGGAGGTDAGTEGGSDAAPADASAD